MAKRIDPLHMRWPEHSLLAEYIKQNPNLTFIPKSADAKNAYSVQIGNGYKESLYNEKYFANRAKTGKVGLSL